MYTFEVLFRVDGAVTEDVVVAASSLLSAWYKSGQICAPTWPLAKVSEGLKAFVSTPAADALDPDHANRYVRDAAATLATRFGAVVEQLLLGHDPESAPECVCEARAGYILFTHYLTVESPLRCADCFLPLPLYAASPPRDFEHLDVITWADDYKACDTLQMNTAVGERFGENQLGQFDSALSRKGHETCRRLAEVLGKPVYYYLHRARGRSVTSERERRCPNCNQAWLLAQRLHRRFDFQCDNCHLLSNIASSLGT